MYNFLIFLYFATAAFYLIYGVLNISGEVNSHISKLFPLLYSIYISRGWQTFWLLFDGVTLFGVGYLLLIGSIVGLYAATALSLWEILLAYTFYWGMEKDKLQAIGHFVIHLSLLIMISNLL